MRCTFSLLRPFKPASIVSFFLLVAVLWAEVVSAQTFTCTASDSIPDNGAWMEFALPVGGLAQTMGTDFGLASVCFSIKHPYVSDLQIHLVSPWGQSIVLLEGVGGSGDDFFNTVLGKNTLPFIGTALAPFTGEYRPQQSLGLLNTGQPGNGMWKLRIRDTYPVDRGFLQNWCITFSANPVAAFAFASSNLPILVINTGNQPIADEPKTPGFVKVLANESNLRNYVSDTSLRMPIPMGIELRGSSSQGFPKKSYGLELRTRAGEDSALSLLGMPAESDWVLSASYSDKTFMRNAMAYHIARSLGRYAPRTRYAELIVNNEYQGIYVVTEKIKRDENRVDISKLKPTDTSGANLTGGYIIKIDKPTGNGGEGFASNYLPAANANGQKVNFLFDYPKAEELHPKQRAYIQSYIDSFETAVNADNFADPALGYRRFMDINSFIDMFLVNEYSKNVDGYRISTYLTKPKITQPGGGRLHAGPVWDYDLGFHNADYCSGDLYTGWSYNFPSVCPDDGYQPPTWWKRFRTDNGFKNDLRCRWEYLINQAWTVAKQNQWIDSVASLLNEAQQRNFEYWPILGTYVWPNPGPIATTYADEIENMKTWLQNRRQWVNSNIGGTCQVENAPVTQPQAISCVPNPASTQFQIVGLPSLSQCNLQMFNALGQLCKTWHTALPSFPLDGLPAGVYTLRVSGLASPLRLLVEAR